MNKTRGEQLAELVRDIAKCQCMRIAAVTIRDKDRYHTEVGALTHRLAELLDAEAPHSNVESVTSMELLASLFRSVAYQEARAHGDWRQAAANTLNEIAAALRAGQDPKAVAIVCEGAAQAFVTPRRAEELRRDCARKLEEA